MNFDIVDTMVRTATDAIRNACIRDKGIAAGACVLASDGTIYSGCSIDHPVPEKNLTAEVVAMARAIADGKREFDALAIIADIDGFYIPDADTCDFLSEFEIEEIILADLEGNVKVVPFDEIEPYRPRTRN